MGEGITFILGCPGSGKTTLAYQLLKARASDGRPALVIDPQRVAQFVSVPHAETVRAAVEAVWGRGEHVAYTPVDVEDFDKLMSACRAGKNVHVLIDEARFFMSGRTVPPGFSLLSRVYRHAFSDVIATSQSYQDAGRPVKAVVGEWRVGRMTAPGDLDALRADLALDPAEIAALPQYEFRTVKVGF